MFRQELDTTAAHFVERIRLDRARALLDDGNNATDAARAAGFASYETMRRAFTKNLGVSPRQYQQRFATTKSLANQPSSWLDDLPPLLPDPAG
jgi:transcriptional regulator GlxA family with amidase domain